MLTPASTNLISRVGDDFSLVISVTDGAGDPFDFTGCTGLFRVYNKIGTTLLDKTSTGDAANVALTSGTITVTLPRDDSEYAALPAGEYRWEIAMTLSTGELQTWVVGDFVHQPRRGAPGTQSNTLSAEITATTVELTVLTPSTVIPVQQKAVAGGVTANDADNFPAQFANLTAKPEVRGGLPTGVHIAVVESGVTKAISLMNLRGFITPDDYGAAADGATDDTAAIQAAFNAALASTMGRVKFLPGRTYRWDTTIEFDPVSAGRDLVIDAEGADLSYQGTGYGLYLNQSGVHATARRLTWKYGRYIWGASATGMFRLDDVGKATFVGMEFGGPGTGVCFNQRNDSAWSENNTYRDCKAHGFASFLKCDKIGTVSNSMARTRVFNFFGSGGVSGEAWFDLGADVYGSAFRDIRGNINAGAVVFRIREFVFSGTTIADMDFEGGAAYLFDILSSTNAGPRLDGYIRAASPMTSFTASSALSRLQGASANTYYQQTSINRPATLAAGAVTNVAFASRSGVIFVSAGTGGTTIRNIVSDFRDGQVIKITNVGAEPLVFDNEALTGTATYNLKNPGEADITLKRYGTIEYTYSTINQRWICTGLAN